MFLYPFPSAQKIVCFFGQRKSSAKKFFEILETLNLVSFEGEYDCKAYYTLLKFSVKKCATQSGVFFLLQILGCVCVVFMPSPGPISCEDCCQCLLVLLLRNVALGCVCSMCALHLFLTVSFGGRLISSEGCLTSSEAVWRPSGGSLLISFCI